MSNATHKTARKNKLNGIKKTKPFAKDLLCLGTCQCGGGLFAYLGSNPENRFNVYCMTCGSVSDIRKVKPGDAYDTTGYQNPMEVLCGCYKTFKNIDITDEELEKTPVSPLVNDVHGAL